MAGWRVVMSGQSLQLGVLLDHQAGWINVIEQFVDDIRQAFFEGAQA